MFYPLRGMRRKQNRMYARKRLREHFFRIIEKRRLDHSRRKKAVSHVRFTGKIRVVSYDKGTPPATSLLRRPSHIDDLSEGALLAEAKRLQILPRSEVNDELKRKIGSKWCNAMRSAMKTAMHNTSAVDNMDFSSIADCDVEDFYNLFLAVKRSANLLLCEESLIPQNESLNSLTTFMKQHGLFIPPHPSRNECIQVVEKYLLDHVPPLDSPLGDLPRRRLSATDLFNAKYGFASSATLRRVIVSHGVKAPKSLLQRKKTIIEMLGKEMKEAFAKCFRRVLRICLAYRGLDCASSSLSVQMKSLFDRMKEKGEIFPEETE